MNIRMRLGVAITLSGMYIVASCDDDVTAPSDAAVGSIVLELAADTLAVKQTAQLHVTVLSVSGETLTGEPVTFESSDEDIATISDTGLVRAVGPGRATITARADDRAASITINVRRAASISVAPSDTTLFFAERLRLTATVLDARGAPVVDPFVRWTEEIDVPVVEALGHRIPTGSGSFFVVGPTATMVALGLGNETITVETEGLTARVDITVAPSNVGSVLLLPDSVTVAVGETARLTVIVRDKEGRVIDAPFDIFCGDSLNPPGHCWINDQVFATITGTLVHRVIFPNVGPVPVVAQSRGVRSNTIWLTTR